MNEETTCDWCAIDLLEDVKAPDTIGGETVCYACYLTYWWVVLSSATEGLQAAQEDSPPET